MTIQLKVVREGFKIIREHSLIAVSLTMVIVLATCAFVNVAVTISYHHEQQRLPSEHLLK